MIAQPYYREIPMLDEIDICPDCREPYTECECDSLPAYAGSDPWLYRSDER